MYRLYKKTMANKDPDIEFKGLKRSSANISKHVPGVPARYLPIPWNIARASFNEPVSLSDLIAPVANTARIVIGAMINYTRTQPMTESEEYRISQARPHTRRIDTVHRSIAPKTNDHTPLIETSTLPGTIERSHAHENVAEAYRYIAGNPVILPRVQARADYSYPSTRSFIEKYEPPTAQTWHIPEQQIEDVRPIRSPVGLFWTALPLFSERIPAATLDDLELIDTATEPTNDLKSEQNTDMITLDPVDITLKHPASPRIDLLQRSHATIEEFSVASTSNTTPKVLRNRSHDQAGHVVTDATTSWLPLFDLSPEDIERFIGPFMLKRTNERLAARTSSDQRAEIEEQDNTSGGVEEVDNGGNQNNSGTGGQL